jgi:Zn-finger nucleic acid-binding protein
MTSPAFQNEKKLLCPNCRAELAASSSEGAEIDSCPGCGGIWVDFADEKALLRMQPQVFTVDEIKRLRRVYEPLGKVDAVKYRKCPHCDELMYRRNWGGHSGVIVDRCEKHGHWYDAGEVEKIREYIALGGIEYEKYAHADRGLTELRDKLKKEVSRLDTKFITERHALTRYWSALT